MAGEVDLTVRLTEAPGAPEYVFRLVFRSGTTARDTALEGSTLPDPDAALAAVERFGEEVFFVPRRADMMCTQQYGGPQVAVVTGTFHGRPVHSRFSLTDGCEIARWRSMAPLFGGTPGSTGQT
jgi:phosphoglycolate phosphatase-like HAD superfamily hydrolase